MVDSVSAEDRIKELLEESRNCTYPEDAVGIKQRYKDTALILFKQSQEDNPKNYLSFGTRRSSAVSQYGNTPIVVRRSRSSNGELSTVVEQVPSLRGRSSISDYTLVEAREKDEEDTDTEDELSAQKFKDISEGNESVGETESTDDSRGNKNNGTGKQNHEYEPSKSSEKDDRTASPLQENDKSINGLQNQDCENRKSFSHYDIPKQRHKDHDEGETKTYESERKEEKDENLVEEPDDTTASDTTGLADINEDSEGGLEEKMSLKSEHDNENHTSSHDRKSSLTTEESKGDQKVESHKENETRLKESHRFSENVNSDSPEVDHEAVLRAYIQQSSSVNVSLQEKQRKLSHSESLKEKLFDDFKFVELKIVEPIHVDDPPPPPPSPPPPPPPPDAGHQSLDSDTPKTLTTDILNFGDDDDDVIFIDANSPMLARTKIKCESSLESSQELPQMRDNGKSPSVITTPTPLKHQVKSLAEYSPPLLERSLTTESPQHLRGDSVEDVSKYLEIENHSGLLDLPIRSPTPPKKSPRRSPRVPKVRDKNKLRHSSLVFSTDEESQEFDPKGTRSASPSSKSKDTSRFFSFSLKKEKSKSASSLSSKKVRDKDRQPAMKMEDKDPGVVNSVIVADPKVDGQFETFGKRVGVRSMVIDGTIKRNFIVIHPSDDSETIGLAPLSPASNGKNTSMNTSMALSSVKSHITGQKNDKFESVKRISSKGDLKEELTDVSRNVGGSLNLGQMSKSLRVKKSKKIVEHKALGSSQSLSSEPTSSSVTDSQVLFKSPLALSEVDCDSLNNSAQRLNDTATRTVSKLCVVM